MRFNTFKQLVQALTQIQVVSWPAVLSAASVDASEGACQMASAIAASKPLTMGRLLGAIMKVVNLVVWRKTIWWLFLSPQRPGIVTRKFSRISEVKSPDVLTNRHEGRRAAVNFEDCTGKAAKLGHF